MLLVVVDTNVWISALLTPHGPPAKVAEYLGTDAFTPVLTAPLLEELSTVGRRRRLVERFGLTESRLVALTALLLEKALTVPSENLDLQVCRDPRDDMFLAAAITADADFIVTRDNDLKRDPAVATFLAERKARALSVREFLQRLANDV